MSKYQHLKLWKYPPAFMLDAENTMLRESSYPIYGRHRGRSIMEDVNYTLILKDLQAKEAELGGSQDELPWVYDQRDSCSFAGWVECIYVRMEAPDKLLKFADDILHKLEGYPVYNEDKYGEAQYEAINSYWDLAHESEKLDLIVEQCDVDEDEAQRIVDAGEFPNEVYDYLSDSAMFW